MKLSNVACFKDRFPKELTSAVIYKFQCGFCNESCCGEYVSYLNVTIGEHIRVSTWTKKKVK